MPAESVPTPPHPLEALIRAAEALRALGVTRIETAAGAFDLTAAAEPGDGPEPAGSPAAVAREAKILAALRERDVPVTRKKLAALCGRKSPKGDFGETLRAMLAAGRLFEDRGLVTDDRAKLDPEGDD